MIGMWTFKLQPVPKVSKKLIIDLAPVALFHTIAHVSACVSFSKMAVSFTHVIKVSGGKPSLLGLTFFLFFFPPLLSLFYFCFTNLGPAASVFVGC